MKYLIHAALTCGTIVGLALGASPPQKKAVAPSRKSVSAPASKNLAPKAVASKKAAPKTVASKTAASKTAASKTAAKKGAPTGHRPTYGRRYTSYRRTAHHYTAQQMAPTADRYREIQDALAAKGYLKTSSTGVWDADSVDAMQRFQKDKNLDPTGKLTAKSLSALGLGPKPPDTTASLGTHPGSESTPLQ